MAKAGTSMVSISLDPVTKLIHWGCIVLGFVVSRGETVNRGRGIGSGAVRSRVNMAVGSVSKGQSDQAG